MINEAIWLAEKIYFFFGLTGIAVLVCGGIIIRLSVRLIKGIRYREIEKRKSPYTWPAEFDVMARTKRWN